MKQKKNKTICGFELTWIYIKNAVSFCWRSRITESNHATRSNLKMIFVFSHHSTAHFGCGRKRLIHTVGRKKPHCTRCKSIKKKGWSAMQIYAGMSVDGGGKPQLCWQTCAFLFLLLSSPGISLWCVTAPYCVLFGALWFIRWLVKCL